MAAETSNKILQRRRRSLEKLNTNEVQGLPSKKDVWSTDIGMHPLGDGSNRDDFMKSNSTNHNSHLKTTATSDGANSAASRQTSKLSIREKYLSWRYVIVLLLHSSFMVAVHVKNAMPMAMVCMVKQSSQGSESHANSSSELDSNFTFDDTFMSDYVTSQEYEFDWDKELQGLLLTSVSFLSCLGPIAVDIIRQYLGNKWTLTLMSILTALLTILSPVAARINPFLLMAVRTVSGIVIVANLPITGDTCAWWSPSDEKQTMVSIIFSGVNIGGVIAAPLAGVLCGVPYDNGWPFVFYVFGGIILVWTIAWHFLSSQRPEDHPFISENEKEYIIKHRVGLDSTKDVRRAKLPYGVILRSSPVLAFLVVGSIHVWTSSIFFINMPSFMTTGLGFDVVQTGLLISCLSVSRFFGLAVWTSLVNCLLRSKKLSVTSVRKLAICTGLFAAAAGQVAVVFLEREAKWAIFGLQCFVMLSQSVGTCVVPVLPLDMAPRYAGFLTGLFYAFGSLMSISGPLIVSALTPTGSIEEWRLIWLIMAALFTFALIIFGIFGSAKLQPWAVSDPDKNLPVISMLAVMGRRFSTLALASPISPATPIQDKGFDLTRDISPVHQLQLNGQLSYRADQSLYYHGDMDEARSRPETNAPDEVVIETSSDPLPVTGRLEMLPVVANSASGNSLDIGDRQSNHLTSGGYWNQSCDVKEEYTKQTTLDDTFLASDASIVTHM